jgi:hypothetical protein
MKTLGGEAPSMSSVAMSGTLFMKLFVLSIMGQRVLPQSILEPLHMTHKSVLAGSGGDLAVSGACAPFRMSLSQFSDAVTFGIVVGLRSQCFDGCLLLICFLLIFVAKFAVFRAVFCRGCVLIFGGFGVYRVW